MPRLLPLLIASLLLGGCEDHSIYFEREPEPHQWGTFGEEIYRVLLGALSGSDQEARARGLAWRERRAAVIEAADATLPPALYEPAEAGLAGVHERIDDGTLPRVTRSTSRVLEELAQEENLVTLRAAATLGDGPWLAERDELYDLGRHLALAELPPDDPRRAAGQDPRLLVHLGARGLALAREHDGRDDRGALTEEEPQELRELLRALSLSLRDPDLGELDEARTLDDSLLERLIAAAGISYAADPIWVVRGDGRGLPRVAIDPASGTVYAPFVDRDGDGLADIDAEGRFVRAPADTTTLDIYGHTERHARSGQALAYNGRPLYQYEDFGSSGLGVVARGLQQIVLDGRHGELIHHVDDLLRPREVVVDERDGTLYESFPAGRTESLEPGFDLMWALIEASRERPPDRLLYGAEDLIIDHRGAVRNLLEQAMIAGDAYAETPHGELNEHNTLLDDLILEEHPPGAVCYGRYDRDLNHTCTEPPGPLALRLIESGVLRDLIDIFDDPAVGGLARALVELMSHRDDPIRLDQTALRQPLLTSGETPENRSVGQRMLHLVHDANGATFSTWLTEAIDWRIENLAVFFLESYCEDGPDMIPEIGLLVMSDFFGDTRPSPREIAEFMAVDHSRDIGLWDNPRGREGRELYRYNADTLLALEFTGANEALRPLVQVFCDHDELLLLANLFTVLYEHWSTLPEYTTGMAERFDFYTVERPAGLAAVEPALTAALSRSDVVNRALRVGSATTEITVDGRVLADEAIDLFHHLIDPEAAVLLRLHEGEPERDLIYHFDRYRVMAHPTHLNAIAQRAAESADAWEAEDQEVRDHLTGIFDILSEAYLDWPGEDALRRDQADYMVRLAERALPELADWTRENLDRDRWDEQIAEARTQVDDLEVSLTDLALDPLLPAVLDVVVLLLDDPLAGPLLRQVLLHFLTPSPRGAEPGELPDPLTALARVVGALFQARPDRGALEQLLRWLSVVLDPINSPAATVPGDLALLTGSSPDSAVLRALANGLAAPVEADANRAPSLAVIAEALVAVGRQDPGSPERLAAEDLAALARHAVVLLEDHQHGLERIYAIVGERARD